MLALTGAWDRGLVPTLGGGAQGHWDLPSNGFVKFIALYVAKRDSAHTSLRVSDYRHSDPQHTKTCSKTSRHSNKFSTHLFWELARQVIREFAHAGFADTVEGRRGRQPS